MKSILDKLDVDKLVPVPFDLSKLSDAAKKDVVKKYVYNSKIKNIGYQIPDITNLATKTTLNVKINEVKCEIPNITNLATNASLYAKINEVKDKTPSITNLATTNDVTTAENKIPSVSNLVRKNDYNTKVNEIEKKTTDYTHDKYITTPKFNKLRRNFCFKIKTSKMN